MGQWSHLSTWFQGQPKQIVAVRKGEKKTFEDLEHRVAEWVVTLASSSGTRWAVYHNDAYEFLAILLALWQLDRVACIPGDNRPGTMQRLALSVDGFVGQCETPDCISEVNTNGPLEVNWKAVPADFICLEIYTSGSTGEPKSITKTMTQLELEIESLEALWSSLNSSVVLATVTHQHMYGITFRLLWPLSAGRPFEREWCEYTEDILHVARCYSSFILISSPSHLGRINTTVDWQEIAGCCDYVVSSAAPLSCEDSLNAARIFCAPVREIYGSSETGAVAWREQNDPEYEALWRALPEVEVEPDANESLIVWAPYLPAPGYFALADRVEFNRAGDFRLMGRVDRVVKVEGKRISLTAIENLLVEHQWVKNCRALTIEKNRVETAVVVELNEQGQAQFEQLGSKQFIKHLKSALSNFFEAVVMPRRWRFVDQMPVNRQGKLPLDSLLALFEKDEIKWPDVQAQRVSDCEATLECRIPSELIYFEGHFPDNPILPGIVQTHWAEFYGRQLLSVEGEFISLEAVKFQQVIPPESLVTLTLKYNEIKNKLTFQYESNRGVHSSGRICFG